MKFGLRKSLVSFLFASALALPAAADTLTLKLTCVLGNTACTSGPSFGTITLVDTGANQVQLTVNVLNTGIKFRDLALNLTSAGLALTDITSSLSENLVISSNGFSNPNYTGLFDLGVSGAQGWNTAGPTPYVTTLAGVGGTLKVAMFNQLDSLNNVYAEIHLQSISCDDGACTPQQTGRGSIKVGGILDSYVTTNSVPEPQSAALLGTGLIGLAFAAKRMRRK